MVGVLEHEADGGRGATAVLGGVEAVYPHLPAVGFDQPGNQPQQLGLARAVPPDQPDMAQSRVEGQIKREPVEHLPPVEGKAGIVQRDAQAGRVGYAQRFAQLIGPGPFQPVLHSMFRARPKPCVR